MMLTKIQSLFSLGNSAQHFGVKVLQPQLGLFQEGDGLFEVLKLATCTDCDQGILHWVHLVVQCLHHGIVQGNQVFVVVRHIKGPVFEVSHQRVCDVMPQPSQVTTQSVLWSQTLIH